MAPPALLCEDCGDTLHKLCGKAILINKQKEWICSQCVDRNKTRNNECCNGPMCKWHDNNTIGAPRCECNTCGKLVHSECTKDGKTCHPCSLERTRTIPYGTVDKDEVSSEDVSNYSSDDDIPVTRRGPSAIIDTDDDNSFEYNVASPTRTGTQSDFFNPISDKQDSTYLDNESYSELDQHSTSILSRIRCTKTQPRPQTNRNKQRKHE